MEYSKSQQKIMQKLKFRGPQSVKILSNQIDMTTMGVRQHLMDLDKKGLVKQTLEAKQRRGRPIRLWKLTKQGHHYFTDGHAQLVLEIIDLVRELDGEEHLNELIKMRNTKIEKNYTSELKTVDSDLSAQVKCLAELRNSEGYMSEVRLLPDGWLLVENHCPIYAATKNCRQFYHSELSCLQNLFEGVAKVQRLEHVLTGARRCAYKISPLN